MKTPIQVNLRREKFEKLAARANLQKGEIAEKINVSDAYLSRIISGRDQLSPRRRRILQEVLNADFDSLFFIRRVDDRLAKSAN